MPVRQLARKAGAAVLLLAALAAAVALGPWVVKTMTPDRLAAADDLLDRIWWPATALRLAVYALLAWGAYPAWVRERAGESVAGWERLPSPGTDPLADAERVRHAARLAHLERAARRQGPVFLLFLASDLLVAQCPYWLLRG